VAYPIVMLREGRRDLHAWMRALEQAVIDTLEPLGLRAGRREGATGVWIDGQRKICSIGVAASRWVTYHGLALNVGTDLAHFTAIAPCGFEAGVMTSVRRELGAAPSLAPPLQRALAERVVSFAVPR
jgi:lipoate-protein ligase B